MLQLVASADFEKWLDGLRDGQARTRIIARLRRVALGNLGDAKPVGAGISELRIPYGPGYRVYITRRGSVVVVLLCGGDKSTQAKDIAKARAIAEEWKG